MSNVIMFLLKLYKEVKRDDLLSVANDLTFKILLALFPFMMFLMSLVSYFNIDSAFFISSLEGGLPNDVMDVISPFIIDLTETRRPSILSISIVFMIFSASSGFNTVIKGINKAYGQKDTRNFFRKRLVSVILVLLFAVSIVFSLVMLIFNDNIYRLVLIYFQDIAILSNVFSFFGYLITVGVLLFSVMAINSLALARKNKFRELMPGSCFTVICWVVLSRAFNFYVNHFSRYSTIYGSVASIMLMMIWLNLICIAILIGSEINAIIKIDVD